MTDDRERFAEQLLGVVNDTARAVSTRFVTFLSVAVYVGITLASTSDEMLLRGTQVALPLLNIQIPIKAWYGFYTVAPWLLVALHLDLLLQFQMLATKLAHFRAALTELSDEQRSRLHERMASYYYLQFLARESPTPPLHMLSGLVVVGTVVIVPLLLLCWAQVRLLPLRDLQLTLANQAAVLVSAGLILALLWRLLGTPPQGLPAPTRATRAGVHRPSLAQALALTVCVAAGVVSLVTWLPDAVWTKLGLPIAWRAMELPNKVLTVDGLSPQAIETLESGDAQSRDQELSKVSRLSFLQGQDLRYAYMFKAVLPKVDIRSLRREGEEAISRRTNLQQADLSWAVMPQVQLDDAWLQGAKLVGAQLQGGQLTRVRLDGANLALAQLQDARLNGATLSGATLADARLQGADLSDADLRPLAGTGRPAAALKGANLQGAILRRARLQGADLSSADLRGADLTDANLLGANLKGAHLGGAIMLGAVVAMTDLAQADVELVEGRPASAAASTVDRAHWQAVNDLLVPLACDDAYVARGLGSQATMRRDGPQDAPLRPLLAQRLLERLADPKCQGLSMLPPGAKTSLEREAKRRAAAAP